MMLTPEDSKRVADALIAKIEDTDVDVGEAVRSAVMEVVMPHTSVGWVRDWFPLMVQEMFDDIRRGVIAAADRAAEKE